MTRSDVGEAKALGETLTLVEPAEVRFAWKSKSQKQLEDERGKHLELVNQLSMLNDPVEPLEPCPFEFTFKWKSVAGSEHSQICDDWETSTAFFHRRRVQGELAALQSLKQTYEVDYLNRGMRFALGTHSRRDQQWLLVGVLRVDDQEQGELL